MATRTKIASDLVPGDVIVTSSGGRQVMDTYLDGLGNLVVVCLAKDKTNREVRVNPSVSVTVRD